MKLSFRNFRAPKMLKMLAAEPPRPLVFWLKSRPGAGVWCFSLVHNACHSRGRERFELGVGKVHPPHTQKEKLQPRSLRGHIVYDSGSSGSGLESALVSQCADQKRNPEGIQSWELPGSSASGPSFFNERNQGPCWGCDFQTVRQWEIQ